MKKSLAFSLVIMIFCSFFSLASFGSEKKYSFELAPREFAVFQIQDTEVLPFETYQYSLPENTWKAVQASPLWLQQELTKTFQDLDRRPIQMEGKSKPAFGDVNHDSFQDLVLISSNGECTVYLDQGFPFQYCIKKETSFLLHLPDNDPLEEKSLSFYSPSLFDINQDGLDDLFFGYSNCIYYCKNSSTEEEISFDPAILIYTPPVPEEDPPSDPDQISEEDEEKEEEKPEAFSPFVFLLNETPSMVVGKKEGTLFLLSYEQQEDESFQWVEKPAYFTSWNEHWLEEPEKEGVAVYDYATPSILPLGNANPSLQLMCIGSASGNFSFFLIHTDSMLPQIQTTQVFPPFETPQWTSPTFKDINRDGRIDFVFGAADGKIYTILNDGDSIQMSWNPLNSKAEMNNLKNFFGGIGFHRAYDALYCVGNNTDLIEKVSSFILEVDPLYQDEVVYCIANFQTTDIIQYFQSEIQDVLIENAKGIYDMAQQVNYCSILEEDGYTTLQYKTWFNSDGEKTDQVIEEILPKEIYYNYLVMMNRYLLIPTRWESFYEKNFYRTYLPYDKTYVHGEAEEKTDEKPSSVTLFERVKDAETLYDAAWNIMFWLKDDIGGVWHTGEKPPGWYNIYHNLLNKEVGIWCGEWSIIYEACARAMNIPTIIIIGLGEDHQYNNFYDYGWHHVDPSAGESGNTGTWEPYIGNSLIYYEKWGKRIFSWPMEWEGNGKYDHVWRSALPYNPPEKLSNLSFTVVDKNHRPVEGARIELWSHWPMENNYVPVPFPSAFGYTDSLGSSSIQKVGHQNFTCVVTSRIGTSSFYIPLRDADNTPELSYSVVLSEAIQPLYRYTNAAEPNFIVDAIDPLRIPVSEEYPEPFLNEEKQLYYCPVSLLTEVGCSVMIEENTVTVQSEEHTLVLKTEETSAILDGKEMELLEHQVPIWYKDTVYICFETTLLMEVDTRFNEMQKQYVLYVLSSRLCSIQFDKIQAIQKNHHWIDGYTTILEYIDYWKPSVGSFDCIVLSENELWNILHGESVRQCDWTTINSTDEKPSFGSTLHKDGNYYIVLVNPNFATTLSGEISFQINP